jgi:hypothetical protein
MQKTETAELVEWVSVVDRREVTPQLVAAWHEIIGFLDYEVAKQALLEVQRDSDIRFIEPKHIVAFSYKIKERTKREQSIYRELETDGTWGSPMPKCVHGKGLLYCDPCCHAAAKSAGLIK